MAKSKRKQMPHATRKAIFDRHDGKCANCGCETRFFRGYLGRYFDVACVDHIQPVSRGGGDEEDNLQLLCWTCNARKYNKC